MAPPLATAVLLNHFFIVPTPDTYEALRQSAFLRESFAVFEARTTVRQDLTYTGIYFYGDHTYFEFLPPGPGFAEANAGVAFGVEESGAGARLRDRLEEGLGVKVGDMGITRQAEGKDVPWFRMVAAQTGQGMGRFATWTMEYEASFLEQWFPDLPPRGRGVARAAVLDRYVAKVGPPDARASHLLEDVTVLRLALGPDDRKRFLAQCRLFGHAVEEGKDGTACRGPDVRFALVPGDGGIVGFEMTLRRAVDPPAEHRFGQSVLRLGPGKTATWSFAGP